jgi:hypothetical protein
MPNNVGTLLIQQGNADRLKVERGWLVHAGARGVWEGLMGMKIAGRMKVLIGMMVMVMVAVTIGLIGLKGLHSSNLEDLPDYRT